MTERGQSIGISNGMLPQTLIMSITVQKTSKYYTTEFDLEEWFLNGACISISNLPENIAWQTHGPQEWGLEQSPHLPPSNAATELHISNNCIKGYFCPFIHCWITWWSLRANIPLLYCHITFHLSANISSWSTVLLCYRLISNWIKESLGGVSGANLWADTI